MPKENIPNLPEYITQEVSITSLSPAMLESLAEILSDTTPLCPYCSAPSIYPEQFSEVANIE